MDSALGWLLTADEMLLKRAALEGAKYWPCSVCTPNTPTGTPIEPLFCSVASCLMRRPYRLRRNNDFQQVRHSGKIYASSLMVLAFLQNELDDSRFGFVVNKRLGQAVERNKIKRRMREAVRRRIPQIQPGFDLVFIARQPIREANYTDIEHTLDYLLKKSGLLLNKAAGYEIKK
jgi:ribonuclease P protein component